MTGGGNLGTERTGGLGRGAREGLGVRLRLRGTKIAPRVGPGRVPSTNLWAADLGSLSQLTGPSRAITDAQPSLCEPHPARQLPRAAWTHPSPCFSSFEAPPFDKMTNSRNSQVWPNLCRLHAQHCICENFDQTLPEFCLEF